MSIVLERYADPRPAVSEGYWSKETSLDLSVYLVVLGLSQPEFRFLLMGEFHEDSFKTIYDV